MPVIGCPVQRRPTENSNLRFSFADVDVAIRGVEAFCKAFGKSCRLVAARSGVVGVGAGEAIAYSGRKEALVVA
jgi:hypothetical protein